MASPEEFTNAMDHASKLVEDALTVTPERLAEFQKRFKKENTRRLAAALVGRRQIENNVSAQKQDAGEQAVQTGYAAISHYVFLTEIIENGTLNGIPVTTAQTLAYYEYALDEYTFQDKEANQ
jgi:hypothetical protein